MLWSPISANFGEKNDLFLKNQATMLQFLHNLSVFWV
jgi:hypothetical protein